MARYLIMAILAIGIFTQIPMLASDWLETNGYLESDAVEAKRTQVSSNGTQPSYQKSSVKRVGKTILKANKNGHFFTRAHINNKSIRVLVDTGATMIALSYEDARKLGLRPTKSDFTIPVNTANGRTYFASAKLRSVRVGRTEERNIKATIAPEGVLDITLLGMSYLKQLKRFEISNGKLVLEN